MGWRIHSAAAFLLLRAAAPADLAVDVRESVVDVRAKKAPLEAVLNALAQKTGMKVIYDTEPPQDPVTLDLRNVSVAVAIPQILRGHGITYAIRFGPSGLDVVTLLLTTGGTPAATGSHAPPPPPPPDETEPPEVASEEPPAGSEPPAPTPSPAPGPMYIPGGITATTGIPGLMPVGGTPSPAPNHDQ
jgi:hypothetical protein